MWTDNIHMVKTLHRTGPHWARTLKLDKEADINLKNNKNKTPLDGADKGSEVERLLLQLEQSAP